MNPRQIVGVIILVSLVCIPIPVSLYILSGPAFRVSIPIQITLVSIISLARHVRPVVLRTLETPPPTQPRRVGGMGGAWG